MKYLFFVVFLLPDYIKYLYYFYNFNWHLNIFKIIRGMQNSYFLDTASDVIIPRFERFETVLFKVRLKFLENG